MANTYVFRYCPNDPNVRLDNRKISVDTTTEKLAIKSMQEIVAGFWPNTKPKHWHIHEKILPPVVDQRLRNIANTPKFPKPSPEMKRDLEKLYRFNW